MGDVIQFLRALSTLPSNEADRDRNPRRLKSLIQVARTYLPYRRIGALLDVGCSFGTFLAAAKSVGWKACGVEVASLPVSIAARYHDVFHGYLSDAPYPRWPKSRQKRKDWILTYWNWQKCWQNEITRKKAK